MPVVVVSYADGNHALSLTIHGIFWGSRMSASHGFPWLSSWKTTLYLHISFRVSLNVYNYYFACNTGDFPSEKLETIQTKCKNISIWVELSVLITCSSPTTSPLKWQPAKCCSSTNPTRCCAFSSHLSAPTVTTLRLRRVVLQRKTGKPTCWVW